MWSWLAALPEDVVRNSAPLSIACCWVLWLNGQIAAIEAHLMDAEAALGHLVVPEGASAADELDAALLAQVATLRSIVARYRYDFAAAWRTPSRRSRRCPRICRPRPTRSCEA